MRPDRRRIDVLVLCAVAAGALAGAFASLGHLAWWLELFTHFRVQYAVWLAVGCLALLWLRRPGLALAALALAAVNAAPLLYYHASGPSPPPATGPEFRAVLLNVFYLNDSHERVLSYVRRAGPDAAVFLEATGGWVEALRSLEDVLPYQARVGEIFVASRRPLTGLRSAPLAPGGADAVLFESATEGFSLTLIGAHLDWPLGPRASAVRDRQLQALADLGRAVEGPRLVLADLNTTAYSPVFRAFLARSRLGDCAAGRGLKATWPARFPPLFLQIDHCLRGPGLEVTRLETGPYLGSDHYPLEVTVRWRGAQGAAERDVTA